MLRILMIDDSFTARAMVCRLLPADYEVVQAGGGRAGLECLRGRDFDLVLLDLLMPEMDGFQTLGEIRTLRPALPVLIISADIQESTRKRVLEAGARGIIHKPPMREALLQAIRKAVDQEPGSSADCGEGGSV